MQKKLISLAIAAAVAAPVAAMADVTVYGLMHYSYDWVDGAGDSEGNTGVSRGSRLGFKGSEDLGGGLKGVWQIESQIENGSGAGSFSLRNTFVGLAGDFGTVLAGRHDTPYKLSTGKLDPFWDRAADYNIIMGTIDGVTLFDERAPQTIAYVTPNMNGFSAALAYVDHYFTTPDGQSDTAWSAMVQYDNAGFFATAAYEHQEGANLMGVTGGAALVAALGGEPDADAWKVGLGYTFNGFMVGAIWENISVDGDAGDDERDAFYIPLSYTFGNNVVKAAYGMADELDSFDDSGGDFWAIGFDHNFSKRTTIYALYTMVGNDDNADYRANSGQALSSGYVRDADDEDINVISVGVIHKF
jgi:predicted porin